MIWFMLFWFPALLAGLVLLWLVVSIVCTIIRAVRK